MRNLKLAVQTFAALAESTHGVGPGTLWSWDQTKAAILAAPKRHHALVERLQALSNGQRERVLRYTGSFEPLNVLGEAFVFADGEAARKFAEDVEGIGGFASRLVDNVVSASGSDNRAINEFAASRGGVAYDGPQIVDAFESVDSKLPYDMVQGGLPIALMEEVLTSALSGTLSESTFDQHRTYASRIRNFARQRPRVLGIDQRLVEGILRAGLIDGDIAEAVVAHAPRLKPLLFEQDPVGPGQPDNGQVAVAQADSDQRGGVSQDSPDTEQGQAATSKSEPQDNTEQPTEPGREQEPAGVKLSDGTVVAEPVLKQALGKLLSNLATQLQSGTEGGQPTPRNGEQEQEEPEEEQPEQEQQPDAAEQEKQGEPTATQQSVAAQNPAPAPAPPQKVPAQESYLGEAFRDELIWHREMVDTGHAVPTSGRKIPGMLGPFRIGDHDLYFDRHEKQYYSARIDSYVGAPSAYLRTRTFESIVEYRTVRQYSVERPGRKGGMTFGNNASLARSEAARLAARHGEATLVVKDDRYPANTLSRETYVPVDEPGPGIMQTHHGNFRVMKESINEATFKVPGHGTVKLPEGVNVKWSPINQAWLVLWGKDKAVLRVMHEAADLHSYLVQLGHGSTADLGRVAGKKPGKLGMGESITNIAERRSMERPTTRAASKVKEEIKRLLAHDGYGYDEHALFFAELDYSPSATLSEITLEREWVNPGRRGAPQFRVVATGPSIGSEEVREYDYYENSHITRDEPAPGPIITVRSGVFTYPDGNPSGAGDKAFWEAVMGMMKKKRLKLSEALTKATRDAAKKVPPHKHKLGRTGIKKATRKGAAWANGGEKKVEEARDPREVLDILRAVRDVAPNQSTRTAVRAFEAFVRSGDTRKLHEVNRAMRGVYADLSRQRLGRDVLEMVSEVQGEVAGLLGESFDPDAYIFEQLDVGADDEAHAAGKGFADAAATLKKCRQETFDLVTNELVRLESLAKAVGAKRTTKLLEKARTDAAEFLDKLKALAEMLNKANETFKSEGGKGGDVVQGEEAVVNGDAPAPQAPAAPVPAAAEPPAPEAAPAPAPEAQAEAVVRAAVNQLATGTIPQRIAEGETMRDMLTAISARSRVPLTEAQRIEVFHRLRRLNTLGEQRVYRVTIEESDRLLLADAGSVLAERTAEIHTTKASRRELSEACTLLRRHGHSEHRALADSLERMVSQAGAFAR